MRDRLIDLLTDDLPKADNPLQFVSDEIVERLADMLIANGVIVPPCKVGDTVYIPWEFNYTNGVAFSEVEKIVFYSPNMPRIFIKDLESDMPVPSNFCLDDFGKTIFLTKKEAEQALKGGVENAKVY